LELEIIPLVRAEIVVYSEVAAIIFEPEIFRSLSAELEGIVPSETA
jgi:hypothetical protein